MAKRLLVENEIAERARRRPFEPYRIKLVSGDHYNVVNEWELVQVEGGAFLALQDGNSVVFSYDKIACIESLIEGL